MKVIILAGGYGTRMPNYSQRIPKPMVRIGDAPMLTHMMRIFSSFGFKNFIIAAGYKNEIIKNYFIRSKEFSNLCVVDTGKNTMIGVRILKLKQYFDKNEIFIDRNKPGICQFSHLYCGYHRRMSIAVLAISI